MFNIIERGILKTVQNRYSYQIGLECVILLAMLRLCSEANNIEQRLAAAVAANGERVPGFVLGQGMHD